MPHATMHGTQMTITEDDGNKTTYELVRVGTLKEHETVRAALETETGVRKSAQALHSEFQAKLTAQAEKLATADAAYLAEKETSEGLRLGLAGAEAAFRASESGYADLTTELEAARESVQSSLAVIKDKDAEIEALMTTKASLEETNTALEVSQKELCEAREMIENLEAAFEAEESVSAQLTVERDRYGSERDVSRQALADLKAELLRESEGIMSYFKMLHETYGGE